MKLNFNYRNLLRPEPLLLCAILVLAFYIAYIPHRTYPYALHVDEWVHMARATAMMQSASTSYLDPFYKAGLLNLGTNLEAGYQLFLGVFQAISGISWMELFRFFPSVIFVITVLSVYIMARREGFGLEAAFLAALIPTSVGILGPAFLVPVAMGLLFTPLILFLALNFRSVWSYALIFVFTVFLLAIHAPSAIMPIIILAPYILINLKTDIKHGLLVLAALLAPFLIIFPWILALALHTAGTLFDVRAPTEFVALPRIVQFFGYLPLALVLIGTFSLAMKRDRRSYGLVLGLLTLLLMLVFFYTWHIGVPIMYERGLLFLMLVLSIVGGAGLKAIRDIRIKIPSERWKIAPIIGRYAGTAVCIGLVALVLAVSLPQHRAEPYYRMIDDTDYETFVWIRDNVGPEYDRAVLDPWKATAFTAITGKAVYTRIHMAAGPSDMQAYSFLVKGSADTAFLRKSGISIVYTRVNESNVDSSYDSDNPDLVKVAKDVYLLKSQGQ